MRHEQQSVKYWCQCENLLNADYQWGLDDHGVKLFLYDLWPWLMNLTLAINLTLQCHMYWWQCGQLLHVVYSWVLDVYGHVILVLWYLSLEIWPWTWESCLCSCPLRIGCRVACLSMPKINSLNRDDVCACHTFLGTQGVVCVALRLFSTYIYIGQYHYPESHEDGQHIEFTETKMRVCTTNEA